MSCSSNVFTNNEKRSLAHGYEKKPIANKQTGVDLKINDILEFIFQENRCWITHHSQKRETNLNQNRLRNQIELIIENDK